MHRKKFAMLLLFLPIGEVAKSEENGQIGCENSALDLNWAIWEAPPEAWKSFWVTPIFIKHNSISIL